MEDEAFWRLELFGCWKYVLMPIVLARVYQAETRVVDDTFVHMSKMNNFGEAA